MYGKVYSAIKTGKYRKVFLACGMRGTWFVYTECNTLTEAKSVIDSMKKEGIRGLFITVDAREVY